MQGIKLIEARDNAGVSKSTLSLHSHTSDMYILVEGDNIRKIGYYKNDNSVRSIDLDDARQQIAAHTWETVTSKSGCPITKRIDTGRKYGNHFELTANEKAFVKRLLGDGLRGKRFYDDRRR